MKLKTHRADEWTGDSLIYHPVEVDQLIAAKDRDLADANHMLLAANASADAFRRVAEQSRKQVQRYRHVLEIMVAAGKCSYEDIEGAEKIFDGLSQQLQPTTGASNG